MANSPLEADLMLNPAEYAYTHGINALVAYYLLHVYLIRQPRLGDQLVEDLHDWFNDADEIMPSWALEVINALPDVEEE